MLSIDDKKYKYKLRLYKLTQIIIIYLYIWYIINDIIKY